MTCADKILNSPQFEGGSYAAKKSKLQRSLKSCGKNLYVDFPIIIHEPGKVTIGDDVALGAFSLIWGGGGLTIGNRVMLASGVKIASQGHDVNSPLVRYSSTTKRVIIHNDVWLGLNVVVLPGVEIKEGAVIGAGAVVTKDVEPYTVSVGVPAKPVRIRCTNPKFKMC
ncbi:MAG: DapH/DapD/GlmU-related protein [Candidatus Bathyarchaeia archaeon]